MGVSGYLGSNFSYVQREDVHNPICSGVLLLLSSNFDWDLRVDKVAYEGRYEDCVIQCSLGDVIKADVHLPLRSVIWSIEVNLVPFRGSHSA